ncbi:hypothetical protein ABZP36_028082 [Zizania latifolia]
MLLRLYNAARPASARPEQRRASSSQPREVYPEPEAPDPRAPNAGEVRIPRPCIAVAVTSGCPLCRCPGSDLCELWSSLV